MPWPSNVSPGEIILAATMNGIIDNGLHSDADNSLGAHFADIAGIAVPANPAAGTRRLFVNTATGELSVRTSGGVTISLEGVGTQFSDNETPSGVINGTTGSDGNAVFTLGNAPSPAGSLILVNNNVFLRQGLNYNLAGSTITFISGFIPITGEWLRAWYRY